MFASEGSDPCELAFLDFEDINGKRLPRRWIVRHGDSYLRRFDHSTLGIRCGAAGRGGGVYELGYIGFICELRYILSP